jgi:acetyl esterase
MTEEATTLNVTWREVIASLEATDPSEAASLIPGPSTEQLVRAFPELGAVEARDATIDGPEGRVPARSYRLPGAHWSGALVWVHGGAFIGGDLDMAEAHWVGLTLASRGLSVLSVDYRKCLRGVRFPAPSDDVIAAWLWAIDHARELGTSPERMHLGGASAGANLAAGVTKRLRDGAGPVPASLVLVYPLVHSQLPSPSEELRAVLARTQLTVNFSPETVRDINLQFTGGEHGLSDPYAFAANGDVSRQPPVYILNAEADPLRASGEAYAQRLRDAGVRVHVEFEPGAEHGHVNDPYSPGGQRSLERIATWLAGPAPLAV